MNDKIFLSTGELAKMLGITKQTVIYYDNIGLISPAKRENEYRYYTLEQADELDSILTFRNLGVSIEMLKDYLSVRNAERCIEMLKQQKQKVNMEIQKLDRIRKKIEGRSKLLEQVIKVKDLKKVEFSVQPQEYFMVEQCKEPDQKTVMQSFINLCNRSKELQIDFENPVCSIVKKENLLAGKYRITSFFGIRLPEDMIERTDKIAEEKIIERFEKPKGIYASTYHQGSYDTMHLAYERLMETIKKERYAVSGNAYETDLLSTLTSMDMDEYMKLISIQVDKI